MAEVKEINEKESPTICDTDSCLDNAVPNPVSVIGRMRGPTRRSTKGGWTEEEDKVLAVSVEKFNGKNWKKIAECVPHRSDVQCLHRWQKVLHPDLVKRPWTKEEDALIIDLVAKQGNKKWSEIAKYLPGRIGKQCRERWHNHLNPDIVRTAWTKEEEMTLIEAHAKYGNKWAEIAKFLHGRTENSIKNHWNCTVRKKLELYSSYGSNLRYYGTKGESKNPEDLKRSFDRKVNLERYSDTCLLDLGLGNAKDNTGFRQKEANGVIKSPIGILIDDEAATLCDRTREQCRESGSAAHNSGESNHFITRQCTKSFDTSFSDSLHSSCLNGRTHVSGHLVYSVPSRKPLGNDCSMNYSGRLRGQSINSVSSGLTQIPVEETKVPSGPEIMEEVSHGCLSYEALQLNNLRTLLDTGRFPSTDHYIEKESSPVSFYTPPSHKKGMSMSCGSPESILRSAARSYKFTPSIIRKRKRDCSPEECKDYYNDPLLSPNLHPSETIDGKSSAKKLFPSPPKSQKLEAPASLRSVAKRL
ncbi:Myb_DNA-bind_6 domain-containing protein, partial [Cephalotus follicularis]